MTGDVVRLSWWRWTLAIAGALVAASAVVAGRASGLLDGYWGVAFALVLLLALPTSRLLSRRLALLLPLALGWIPLTYLRPGLTDGLGRVTVVLAACSAGLTLWVLAGSHVRARLDRVLPRVGTVDALLVVAAGAAAVQAGPWWSARGGPQALALLLPGWDNSAHYFMTEAARSTGGFADQLGQSPLGDAYKFSQYPSGFHTVVASLMELLSGPQVIGPSTELVAYVHALWLLGVLCTVGVTAAVLSLPPVRRAPAVAVPLAGMVIVSFTVGPGGSLLWQGFPNFLGAVAVLCVLPVLVLTWSRVHSVVNVLAIGGAVSAIANAWIFLLLIAVPATLVGLVPCQRRRWRARRWEWLALVLVTVATLVSVIRSGLVVLRNSADVTTILDTGGGVIQQPLPLVIAVTLAAVAACVWPSTQHPSPADAARGRGSRTWRRRGVDGVHQRLGWTWVPVLSGICVAAVVANNQLRVGDTLSYYFWKISIAVLLLAVTVIASALALRATPPEDAARFTVMRRALASIVATVAITQVYGIALPNLSRPQALGSAAPGVTTTSAAWSTADDLPLVSVATRLLAAADSDPVPAATRPLFIDAATARVAALQQTQWFLALTLRWTETINTEATQLGPTKNPVRAIRISRDIMLGDPRIVLLTPPESVDLVRRTLAQPSLDQRVIAAPPSTATDR